LKWSREVSVEANIDNRSKSLSYSRINLESPDGGGDSAAKIHLKISWFKATANVADAQKGAAYSAVLSVYLDSVQTRPIYSDVPEVSVLISAGESDFAESQVSISRNVLAKFTPIRQLTPSVNAIKLFWHNLHHNRQFSLRIRMRVLL
jgi:hypothetical protein